MKILIFGSEGMLAKDLVKELSGYELVLSDLHKGIKCDITNELAVLSLIGFVKPTVVINCAAYTDVDGAENNSLRAFKVNYKGVENIAKACKLFECFLVHISTDYVFNGEAENGYNSWDKVDPINTYGLSKFCGEKVIKLIGCYSLIVRTSWLYGKHGDCFPKKIKKLLLEKDQIQVVSDQVGIPTSTIGLSKNIAELLSKVDFNTSLTINCVGNEVMSWYEFAMEIRDFLSANLDKKLAIVFPCNSDKFKTKAKRPKNSTLNHYGFIEKSDSIDLKFLLDEGEEV